MAAASEMSRVNFNPDWMGSTFTSQVPQKFSSSTGGVGGASSISFSANSTNPADNILAPPKLAKNRYGREELLALFTGPSTPAPSRLKDDFMDFYLTVAQDPICMAPYSDVEQRLLMQGGINSSKVINVVNHAERQQRWTQQAPRGFGRGAGGEAPPFPRGAGRFIPPPMDGMGLPQPRFMGMGRGRGDVRGGGGLRTVGGLNPGERYDQSVGSRGGSGPAPGLVRGGEPRPSEEDWAPPTPQNTRAQGLYDPNNPRDRPRQRLKSSGKPEEEDANNGGGGTVAAGVNGGGSGGPFNRSQRRTKSISSSQDQAVPEWAKDDEEDDESLGTFDATGNFRTGIEELDNRKLPPEKVSSVAGADEKDKQTSTSKTSAAFQPSTTSTNASKAQRTLVVTPSANAKSANSNELSSNVEVNVAATMNSSKDENVYSFVGASTPSSTTSSSVKTVDRERLLKAPKSSTTTTTSGSEKSTTPSSTKSVVVRQPSPAKTQQVDVAQSKSSTIASSQPLKMDPLTLINSAAAAASIGQQRGNYILNAPPTTTPQVRQPHPQPDVNNASASFYEKLLLAPTSTPTSASSAPQTPIVDNAPFYNIPRTLTTQASYQQQTATQQQQQLQTAPHVVGQQIRQQRRPMSTDDVLQTLHQQAENIVHSVCVEDSSDTLKRGSTDCTNFDDVRWYYIDPRGQQQGPFENSKMAFWFQEGYFQMQLMIRRATDAEFMPFGELIKRYGNVIPFFSPNNNSNNNNAYNNSNNSASPLPAARMDVVQQPPMPQLVNPKAIRAQMPAGVGTSGHLNYASATANLNSATMPTVGAGVGGLLSQHTSSGASTFTGAFNQPLNTTGQPSRSVWDLDKTATNVSSTLLQQQQQQQLVGGQLAESVANLFNVVNVTSSTTPVAQPEQQQQSSRLDLQSMIDQYKKQQEAERKKNEDEQRRKFEEEQKRILEKQQEQMRREREEADRKAAFEIEQRQKEFLKQQAMMKEKIEREQREREDEQKRQQQAALQQKRLEELARKAEEEEKQRRKAAEEEQRRRAAEEDALRKLKEAKDREQLELRRLEEEKAKRERQKRIQNEKSASAIAAWAKTQEKAAGAQSLKEIQMEEERQLVAEKRQQLEIELSRPEIIKPTPQMAAANAMAWGGASAKSISWDKPPTVAVVVEPRQSNWEKPSVAVVEPRPAAKASAWSSSNKNSSGVGYADAGSENQGFWDDDPTLPTAGNKKFEDNKKKSTSNRTQQQQPQSPIRTTTNQQPKKNSAETNVKRLFANSAAPDEFSKWCVNQVKKLNKQFDDNEAKVFVDFVRNVPDNEVEDYVFSYFEESPSSKEFLKNFFERRNATKKSTEKDKKAYDDLATPASALLPSGGGGGNSATEKESNNFLASQLSKRKTKKSAGTGSSSRRPIDNSILGFKATSDPNRVNVGEIDSPM